MSDVINDGASEVTRMQTKRVKKHGNALKDAAVGHDKIEFTRKINSKNVTKEELLEQMRKKRNDNFVMMMKVLGVFLIFDFLTREFLF